MKIRASKLKYRDWKTRSVLDCGSPLPLFNGGKRFVKFQSASGLAHSKTWRRFVVLLPLLLLSIINSQLSTARAQNYSIDTYKIAGGGGTSTGSVYTVTGTIGQPDAGAAMSGDNYSMTGGFWSLISVAQTPGAPTLFISRYGYTVVIYWQAVSGWNLQQNNNLSSASGWSASSGIINSNGTNYLSINPTEGSLFFRLGQ